MSLLHFHIDNQSVLEVGIDEAGRGPLFGRVYAAAVILPKDTSTGFDFTNIKDSKKFTSKKKLADVAAYIKSDAVAWAVAYEDETTIDNINILQATQSAMHSAIRGCIAMADKKTLTRDNGYEHHLLVDGTYFNSFIGFNKETRQITSVPHTCVKGGDNTYACIAAASILAKTERDEYIEELCETHPLLDERYGIRSNKGYGAKVHTEGIKEHGITTWHRKSFAPCKAHVVV
jgi:ribonuclease HII